METEIDFSSPVLAHTFELMMCIDRGDFFQQIQVWPLKGDLNYRGWLTNFSGAEVPIAEALLDFFVYYSSHHIRQLVRQAVGQAGKFLLTGVKGWNHEMFYSDVFYSYIPGERPNATDSGHLFARKLRDELRIPESRILQFHQIWSRINECKAIILVDDFLGSGDQAIKAWNSENLVFSETLSDLVAQYGVPVVYVPLLANIDGVRRVSDKCDGLRIAPVHVLNESYSVFNSGGLCWKDKKHLFTTAETLLLAKSDALGIPNTGGLSVCDVRGYNSQGFAFSFEHGAPDAVLPIFYWREHGWKPLFNKVYTL